MESLTKREKTLIYILICFLIAVAGWFFLLNPALEKNSLVNAEYEQVQEKLTTIKQQLKSYEEAPKQLEILEKSYNEIAEQYNSILSNDDIDKLLTTKVLSIGFHPQSMSIGEITAATLGTQQQETNSNQTSSNQQTVIKQSTIQMTLTGDLTKLKTLMDNIDKQKGLEIGSLSYQVSNNEANTISLSFILYMVEK